MTAPVASASAPAVEPGVREITYAEALNEALREELRRDPTVFVMGEDVAGWGGGGVGVTSVQLVEGGGLSTRGAGGQLGVRGRPALPRPRQLTDHDELFVAIAATGETAASG